MPMSRSNAGRDLASSNVERQSELADETGRAGRGGAAIGGTGMRSLDREEPRAISRESGASTAGASPIVAGNGNGNGATLTARGSGGVRPNGKSFRGFAAMDASKQKAIASKGGRAAHEKGTAHQWSSDEARNAGRKGGERVSQNRQHMSAIGRRGGEARGMRARKVGQEF